MKKRIFYVLAFICSMGFFTACSDDNNDIETIGTEFDGAYNGTMKIKVGESVVAENMPQSIQINKSGENMFKLQITNFSLGKILVGDIIMDNVPVVKKGNSCSFAKAEEAMALKLGKCKVKLHGNIQDKNTSIQIDVEVLDGDMKGQKVNVDFKGNKDEQLGSALAFDFEKWTVQKSTTTGSTQQFEYPEGGFGTSNDGIMMINDMLKKNFEYPVTQVAGKEGKGAQIKTIYTDVGINDLTNIPYVTAGSLYLGSFKLDINKPLASTKFGIPYTFTTAPTTFTGFYKYTPGKDYYTKNNKVIAEKTDECAIYAVLYEENLGTDGKTNIPLTGEDIMTSDRIVMMAALENGSAKADWTEFSLPFKPVGTKKFDPTKKYQITFIVSSSAKGYLLEGAPNSTLTIDSFKIISK